MGVAHLSRLRLAAEARVFDRNEARQRAVFRSELQSFADLMTKVDGLMTHSLSVGHLAPLTACTNVSRRVVFPLPE